MISEREVFHTEPKYFRKLASGRLMESVSHATAQEQMTPNKSRASTAIRPYVISYNRTTHPPGHAQIVFIRQIEF